MKTLLSYFLLLLLLAGTSYAQTVATITGTASSLPTYHAGPIYRSSASSAYDASRYSYLFTPAELAAAGIPNGAIITKVAWNKSNNTATSTGATGIFGIYMKNSAATDFSAASVPWATQVAGATQVYNNTSQAIPATIGWLDFPLNTNFQYTGGSLEISTDWDINQATGNPTTAAINWEVSTATDRIYGISNTTTPTANLSSTSNSIGNLDNLRPNIQITFLANPCTAPPTGGTTISSAGSTCPNANFTLSLNGTSVGIGLTYQWQSSANGTTGWTNIAGATSSSLTTSQTASTYYRAQVTCSGQTAASTPVQVTTSATPISGTFTIDKNAPASATNFTSFATALASLDCAGAGGPIVFNVVAGSGPYTENVVIPNISGTSATNTITFNGNGNTLRATSSSADATLKLDGSRFIRIDNLVMEADPAATTNAVVRLVNNANDNIISNATLKHNITSSSTSYNLYVYSGSSNNTFQNNTITGGYYGIYNYGASATPVNNNHFIGNTVKDQYTYGIYNYYANNTRIEGNNISRPSRTGVGSFYGITLSTSTTGSLVTKNRIHNSHGAATSLTGLVYALYTTGADATVGNENVFTNNLVYNINNTGTIYGIYSTTSDGAHFFHNTISLDNTANTGTVRGFYQLTTATNVKFQNNIVNIIGGTSGAKHALYFGTTASTITSNNNVLYQTGGASTSGIGYLTSNRATLTDWQAAGAYDQNSVSVDPQFAAPATGDFTPTNAAANNKGGALVPAVTTDINGLIRNPNTPDPGAYEFMNNATDVGITAITSPNSVCGLTATETVTVVLTNFGTNPQSNIPVSYSINGGNPVTATYAGPLAPGANVTYNFTVPANLSTAGGYTFKAYTALTGDMVLSNDTTTKAVSNSLFATLPISLDFETNNTGLTALKQVVNSNSTLAEDAGASSGTPSSTKGLVMAGVSSSAWTMPLPTVNPWTMNPNHLAGVYLCFNPVSGADSLILRFDLKQLYKDANRNTNFRVTVNGIQVGPTYNPPFDPSNPATPIVWKNIRVDLSSYIGRPSIEVGLESSVKEAYAGGNGTANLIDNVSIISYMPTGLKANLLQSQLSVYPNPSNGTFKVDLPQGKTYELTVTDLTGKVIMTQSTSGGLNQLQLNKAAKGIYLLKVKGENGTATRKLIIE
ncbi:T9SS type A sorting domain-containing protein [Adhaeribacter soli]|uniref:T9SS type A sorting domain-containing protein n=1 Tax=Adhaeribacter soli TaxID=2607655 RepID=A0A5N1IM85_9BACT|nr:T9SS type A sorting domain-containing protein [Adhaeribacter soli]KAA9331134.1 T9SS type A sorting domain-containing protein [Adhaeribacter soli]